MNRYRVDAYKRVIGRHRGQLTDPTIADVIRGIVGDNDCSPYLLDLELNRAVAEIVPDADLFVPREWEPA
jgi:hypothetical protein